MVKKTEQEKLKADAARMSRIIQTLATTGWDDIRGIIQDEYDSAMSALLDKENPEARGTINAITRIMDNISQDLKFGEAAQKKYAEKYLKNQ